MNTIDCDSIRRALIKQASSGLLLMMIMPSGALLFKRGRDKLILLAYFKDAIGTQYVEREQAT